MKISLRGNKSRNALFDSQVVRLDVIGKSNIKKVKNFFENCNIEVFTILDRDVIIEGFELLDVTEHTKAMRESLIVTIDDYVEKNRIEADISV